MDIGLPPASPSDKDIDLKVQTSFTNIIISKVYNLLFNVYHKVVPE